MDTIYPWLFKTNAGTSEGVKKAWEKRHAEGEVAKEEPKSTNTGRPKQVDELFSSYDKLLAGIDIVNKKIDEYYQRRDSSRSI